MTPQQLPLEPLTYSRKMALTDDLVADLTLYKALLEDKKEKNKQMTAKIDKVASSIEALRQELRKPVVMDPDEQEQEQPEEEAA